MANFIIRSGTIASISGNLSFITETDFFPIDSGHSALGSSELPFASIFTDDIKVLGQEVITSGNNLGTGFNIFNSSSGNNLQFNTISGAGAVTVSLSDNVITIFGTGGGGGSTVINERPSGTINGINQNFFLSMIPNINSVQVFENGLLMAQSGTGYFPFDYTLYSQVINFETAPLSGSIIYASYSIGATSSIFNEKPIGTIDGVNNIFTLANTPNVSTLQIFLNGTYMSRFEIGFPWDYMISGNQITFESAPLTNSIIYANYSI